MKRKLIDIKDSTLSYLSADAAASGTSLKQYIELMLDQKARAPEDSGACKYNFSLSREPSDRELAAIMSGAAESAKQRNRQAQDVFFENLRKSVKSAR